MADRPHNSFNPVARKSHAQRISDLPQPQKRAVQEMNREHEQRITRLKAEQIQQREAAIQEATRRRLSQKVARHHAPDHRAPQNYRRMAEEAARQGKEDIAARETQDLAYLEQQLDKEREQLITSFTQENRRQETAPEQFQQHAPDTTKHRARARAQNRDRDRER